MTEENPEYDDLEDLVCDRVRDWVRRQGPRVHKQLAFDAEIKIRLVMPQWDEDHTPMLNYEVSETTNDDAEACGRLSFMGKDPP